MHRSTPFAAAARRSLPRSARRRGYGVEIDPLYVDTTIARWEKMTGRQTRHASGKTFAEFKADRAEGGVEASASEDVSRSERMTDRKAPSAVGYKRPPKNTQWQKGQCGNPKRQYKRAVNGTIELIDEAFADQIDIVENGEARQVSVFEAILMQLWFKEISGDTRATAVRLKYQEFVAGQNGGGGGEESISPGIER